MEWQRNIATFTPVIGQTISHYRILDKLGRLVAVKLLPDEMARQPEALERFRHEAVPTLD